MSDPSITCTRGRQPAVRGDRVPGSEAQGEHIADGGRGFSGGRGPAFPGVSFPAGSGPSR